MVRPMLGDVDLEQVQMLETDEDQLVTQHPVPSLDGGFVQTLGRRAARFRLTGVLTAEPTLARLGDLRNKFLDAQPVPFVSDISTATLVDEVLIEAMDVRELAGTPHRVEYRFVLREHTEAVPIEPEPIDVPPSDIPDVEHGTLAVTVVVIGDPAFDFDRVEVSVSGTPDEGPPMGRRVLTERSSDNLWLEDDFPAGEYTVTALVDDNRTPTGEREVLTRSKQATVRNGETTEVLLELQRGAAVGSVFAIHFRFDNAFIEPCLRPVLQRVARYAADHTGRRLLIVGHTDLVGPETYNQALSERRARSAYAYLTFGADPEAAIEEWNELRRPRTAGDESSSRDTWGSREYQHMLQDLGYFNGNVGADFDLTDTAVRRFQSDNGLGIDGDVGDQTWPVLIERYLGQDGIAIGPERFLPNTDGAGCDEGPLRWLGCNEQDPVRETQDAWRPNRRAEFLFVEEAEVPCSVPTPVTLERVPDGAGGGGWCLDPDGTARDVSCFVVGYGEVCPTAGTGSGPSPWCRQPAESGSTTIAGRLQFSDGSPVPNQQFVLTAPDGEYLHSTEFLGENPKTTGTARAGTPIPDRTDDDGRFSHPDATPIGIYSVEVLGPVVVHLLGEPLTSAKGNTVCARLEDDDDELVVVVVDRAVATVTPSITGPDAVLVKKPHTNPARQPITLGVDQGFTGSGTLTRSNETVRLFDAAAGGSEIAFDGTDNVFTSSQLQAGHRLFAEGAAASGAVDDFTLTLALTVGATPGLADSHRMTSVELTVDIGLSRPSAGADPPFTSEADKADPGRPLQLQTADLEAARAMVVVRQPNPATFAGTLTLAAGGNRIRLFDNEEAGTGDTALTLPHPVPAASVPPAGARFFVEGAAVSTAARDERVLLGIDGVDPDGDSASMTVIQLEMTGDNSATAPPLTAVRVGLWDDAFDTTSGNLLNDQPAADHFIDRDSRHFHLRVRDPRAADEVTAGWTTEFDDGTTDDTRPSPPFSDQISLLEAGASSGVFVSRGVMVVTDEFDNEAMINSGMAAGHADAGDRGFGDSNHRVRMITVDDTHQLVSQNRLSYSPATGVDPFTIRLPVFERNPDDRRRINVHLVDVRQSAGGTATLSSFREFIVTETIRDIHAMAGIYADIDRIDIDPPASASSWRANYPGDAISRDPAVELSGTSGTNRAPSTSQSDIIDIVRGLPSFDADDLYLVMVQRIYDNPVPPPPGGPPNGLADGAGGEALPDSFLAAGSTGRGFAFLALDTGIVEFADPHEATHLTTDLRNIAGGHFDLGPATATAAGPIDGKNLMHRFHLVNTDGIANPKRLWDRQFVNTARTPSLTIPAQITAIRGARFTRPY